MQEYERLKSEYYKRFPSEESEKTIETLFYSFGPEEATRMLNEANGRFIVVTYNDQGNDIIEFNYEVRR